jgi:hypothetical protein
MIVLALQCRQRLSAHAFPAILVSIPKHFGIAVGLNSAKLEVFATWLAISW